MTPTPTPTLSDLNSYIAARNLLTPKAQAPVLGYFLIVLGRAKGFPLTAVAIAEESLPEYPVITRSLERQLHQRSVIESMDTTTSGSSQLTPAPAMIPDLFLDLIRPRTLLGRIPNTRKVPLNTNVPTQASGMSFQWIGEGQGTPIGKLSVSGATLLWSKVSGIICTTQELLRFSPVAAQMVQNDLLKGSASFFDLAFIDPTVSAIDYIRPGGILNGIAATGAASGTTAANFRTDLKSLITAINVSDPSELVILLSTTNSLNLSLMGNEFPHLSATGGNVGGLPVIASESVGDRLILLHSPSLLVAEGSAEIDYSEVSTLEMEDSPLAGESSPLDGSTVLKSLWQNDLAAFRINRSINWKFGRSGMVKWISDASYGG